MSIDFQTLEAITHDDKSTVFGYVREAQKKTADTNIPIVIFYICLGYFFDHDYFEKWDDSYMQISNNKSTIEHIKDIGKYPKQTRFAFCKQWIQSNLAQIVKWKLQINKEIVNPWYGVKIRIGANNKCIASQGSKETFPHYTFAGHNCWYRSTWTHGEGVVSNGVLFEEGDIITVILNTKEATIGVIVNDTMLHIIWTGITINKNVRYKMTILSNDRGNSVSILDFESKLL